MSVTIKSPQEIELMREAGKILAKVHEQLGKELKPGMSTLEVDRLGEEMIRSFGCEPSFKGYQGYPASICVSINEEVVHGIPRADRIIEEGDIISIDIPAGKLELKVDEETLAKRREAWVCPPPNVTKGYLARYAKLVSSANKGAVVE